MDPVHWWSAGAVEVSPVKLISAAEDSVLQTPPAATSPRLSTSAEPVPPNCRLSAHYLPLSAAPFFGINNDTGGVILWTCEKFRSFSAKPIRPRESW